LQPGINATVGLKLFKSATGEKGDLSFDSLCEMILKHRIANFGALFFD